ncbi:hypothetical protein NKH18_16450 [Streptomyces sp. M10(2022)]
MLTHTRKGPSICVSCRPPWQRGQRPRSLSARRAGGRRRGRAVRLCGAGAAGRVAGIDGDSAGVRRDRERGYGSCPVGGAGWRRHSTAAAAVLLCAAAGAAAAGLHGADARRGPVPGLAQAHARVEAEVTVTSDPGRPGHGSGATTAHPYPCSLIPRSTG